jgi:hypothetical protein
MRSLLTAWGMATARWRMQPSFIVIGAQRAGTTTLYRLLSEHPDVIRPTASKGIGYFDDKYAQGRRWYRGQFPLAIGRARSKVAFESSGYYLFHPLAPERIARDLPGVRVVAMLRDPVERAYSAHQHEFARGFDDRPFEEAIELEKARLDGEVERICTSPGYASYEHRHHAYLTRSQYSEQLQRYVDLLGRDRVYIVDADRFFAAPEREFAELQRWLELRPWTPEKVEAWNQRRRDPISAELRAELMRHFEPYDDALAALTGRAPSWREPRPAFPAAD